MKVEKPFADESPRASAGACASQAARRGRRNRQRGAEAEREVCALLSDAFGLVVKRRLGQERDGGHDVDLPGFAIEVKRRTAIAGFYDWLEQADQSPGTPVVLARGDGKGWLAVMRLDAWCQLAREEIAAFANAQSQVIDSARPVLGCPNQDPALIGAGE